MEEQTQTTEPINKKKRGGFLMAAGLLLIIAAVALVQYNREQAKTAGEEAALVLTKLEKATSFTELESPDTDMPMISIDGKDYIGRVKIESAEIDLPILAAWDDNDAWTAPARFVGSAYDDSLVLCGHNMPTHFAPLLDLSPGDEVTFTDVNGNVFHYKVVQIYNLKPTQVTEMVTGDWDLTLFTCTYSGTERVTVRCERTEE